MGDKKYHKKLMEDIEAKERDTYIQGMIQYIEDPDYTAEPILFDDNNIFAPPWYDWYAILGMIEVLKQRILYTLEDEDMDDDG